MLSIAKLTQYADAPIDVPTAALNAFHIAGSGVLRVLRQSAGFAGYD
jgi:hypothetical protein